jgi:ribosomal protein L37AE/L43A
VERKLRVADWQVKQNPACPVCELGACRGFMRVGERDYWRCPSCAATFLDPAQRPAAELEHAEYRLHRNAVDDPGYRDFLARLAEPLLERLPPGCAGLDYGCGPAPALAAMLTEAGQRVVIFDPLFFPDPAVLKRRYQFITCTEVVEHFHRPAAEFARLDRLLEPGGWLAIMTTFQTDDRAFADWHYRRDPTHVVFYREATFHTIARRFGWRCEVPGANVVLLQKR